MPSHLAMMRVAMMRETPPRPPGAPPPVTPKPHRIQLLGIDERSSGTDLILANIFKTMRASIGIPPADLVRLLRTRPEVLASLEAGRVRALPPLPELTRLIKDYAALLDIDPYPIISRIKEQTADRAAPMQAVPGKVARSRVSRMLGLAASAGGLWRSRNAAVEDATETEGASVPNSAYRKAAVAGYAPRKMQPAKPLHKARRRRVLATSVVSLVLLLGAAWTAQSQQPVLLAAVDQLPPVMARSLRRGIEMIAESLSSSRGGLTWIETSDPRRRKADKLQVGEAAGR